MKTLKAIALTFLFTIIISVPNELKAQTTNKSILIIKVYETYTDHKDFNKIIVTEDENKLEEVKLQPNVPKYFDSNQIELNKILQKYINKNYHSTSSISTSIGSLTTTTYIYEKDNK